MTRATVTYEIIGLKDAKERRLPGPFISEDGEPVEYIGDDLSESEDAILLRDWRWVATALQAAYDLGRASGSEGSVTE